MKEHRSVNRRELNLRASVSTLGNDGTESTFPVRILNLSTRGALIESADEHYINSVCTFGVVTSDGRNIWLQGRIVWVKAYEDSTYRVGIAFRNLSPDAEYFISLQLVRAKAV